MPDGNPSPLAEANPASLQELFDLDPLRLTDNDLDRIVLALRAQRAKWEASEKTKKGKPATVTISSLDELGL